MSTDEPEEVQPKEDIWERLDRKLDQILTQKLAELAESISSHTLEKLVGWIKENSKEGEKEEEAELEISAPSASGAESQAAELTPSREKSFPPKPWYVISQKEWQKYVAGDLEWRLVHKRRWMPPPPRSD